MDFVVLSTQPMRHNMDEANYETSIGSVLRYPAPNYTRTGYQVVDDEVVFDVEGMYIDGYKKNGTA